MNKEVIMQKYAPRKVANQMEFDRIMSDMNAEQTHLNHPLLDREREIAIKRETIRIQQQALRQQLSALSIEYMASEEKRKEINRVFHDLKHELIMLNPREELTTDKGPQTTDISIDED